MGIYSNKYGAFIILLSEVIYRYLLQAVKITVHRARQGKRNGYRIDKARRTASGNGGGGSASVGTPIL